MTEPVRVHVVYESADEGYEKTLVRHLTSLVRGKLITLSRSGDFADPVSEAESLAVAQAELFLLLATSRLLQLEPRLLAAVQARCTEADGASAWFILAEPGGLPEWPDARQIRTSSSALLPFISSYTDHTYFAIARELQRRVRDIKQSPRRAASAAATRAATTRRTDSDVAPLGGLPQNRYALLVGSNYYQNEQAFPGLNFCVNDVCTLEQTLKEIGYTVVALHDDAPSMKLKPQVTQIKARLKALCELGQPEDLILVQFSCHGFVRDGKQYLAVNDTDVGRLQATALAVADIEQQLKSSPARRRILILDACHSGVSRPQRSANLGINEAELARYALEQAEGFVRIAASTEQQKAQEWQDKKMGAFSYFLNEALRGQALARSAQGYVTVQSAANYILASLRKWSFENLGMRQEPTIQYEGLGELVLADRAQTEKSTLKKESS